MSDTDMLNFPQYSRCGALGLIARLRVPLCRAGEGGNVEVINSWTQHPASLVYVLRLAVAMLAHVSQIQGVPGGNFSTISRTRVEVSRAQCTDISRAQRFGVTSAQYVEISRGLERPTAFLAVPDRAARATKTCPTKNLSARPIRSAN